MRSTVLIGILAVLAGLAIMPAVANDSEAMAPAEIYFFANDVCIEERYIMPGSLKWLPDLPAWADGWATAEGQIVTTNTTFSAGSHIVVAYAGQPTPIVPPEPTPAPTSNNTGIIIGAVCAVLAVGAVGVLIYCLRR